MEFDPTYVSISTASTNFSVDSQSIQTDSTSGRAPCTLLLARMCSRENLCWAARTVGSGMFSTGVTGAGCRHMMGDSGTTPDQGLFIGLGLGLYLGGSTGIVTQPGSEARWNYLKQCVGNAVVPTVTAISVYLAQSHGIV